MGEKWYINSISNSSLVENIFTNLTTYNFNETNNILLKREQKCDVFVSLTLLLN